MGWCLPWRLPDWRCQGAFSVLDNRFATDDNGFEWHCRVHCRVLFMKGDVYSSSAQQCLLSLIATNYLGKSNRAANTATMDSTSGWKSWPLKIYQRNYARAGKATWNSARSVNKKATARKWRAARTSFNPAKTTLSVGTEEEKHGISGQYQGLPSVIEKESLHFRSQNISVRHGCCRSRIKRF